MRDGVDKSVVLLVAPHFANQERRVKNQACDYQNEKDQPQDHQRDLPPIKEYPADVQRQGQRDQAGTKGDKEDNSFSTADDSHRSIVERLRVKVKVLE